MFKKMKTQDIEVMYYIYFFVYSILLLCIVSIFSYLHEYVILALYIKVITMVIILVSVLHLLCFFITASK